MLCWLSGTAEEAFQNHIVPGTAFYLLMLLENLLLSLPLPMLTVYLLHCCGGHLTITPGEGGGTVVTVTIPDSAAQSR